MNVTDNVMGGIVEFDDVGLLDEDGGGGVTEVINLLDGEEFASLDFSNEFFHSDLICLVIGERKSLKIISLGLGFNICL